MNLKTTSYAPLLILVTIVATLVDKYLLGGFGWLSVAAGILALLSVLYLIGRAVQNWIGGLHASQAAAKARYQQELDMRVQLQQRINNMNRDIGKDVEAARAAQRALHDHRGAE